MPEFILDTTGRVPPFHTSATLSGSKSSGYTWNDLDDLTKGYLEAAFFTSMEQLGERTRTGAGSFEQFGFSDLASEALMRAIEDCRKFQETPAFKALGAIEDDAVCDALPGGYATFEEYAGHDFWYTRNGHGCGFWDGDWPEPYAAQLTEAAKAFGEVDMYLGDDGKVYFS